MSDAKSDYFENGILKVIFKGEDLGSVILAGAATNLYFALHKAPIGEGGNQSTNEVSYTGYARVSCDRSSDWTVSGNTATYNSTLTFPTCTGGVAIVSYISIGLESSGAGQILYHGELNPTIHVRDGRTPQILNLKVQEK